MCIFRQPSMPTPAAVAPTPPVPPPATTTIEKTIYMPPTGAPSYGSSSGGVIAGTTANNPVMQNVYDPSNPESGMAAEKGATIKKAAGTSQLRIDLDPVIANMAKQTGLQINK